MTRRPQCPYSFGSGKLRFQDVAYESRVLSETGAGTEVYQGSLTPGITPLRIVVTESFDPTDTDMNISNTDVKFGTLKIWRMPFNIKLDSQTPDKFELSLVNGQPATIVLKNDDPVAYPLFWKLMVNGRQTKGETRQM